MPLGVHSPGHVAATDEQAREELWEHFAANRNRIGRERGWPEASRAEFDSEVDSGSLYVGSPEHGRPQDRDNRAHARRRPLRPEVRERHRCRTRSS